MKYKKEETIVKKTIRLSTREGLAGVLFSLPSLAGFSLFFLVPFGISLYYCFTRGIGSHIFVGFDNFVSLFKSGSFILACKNTLIFDLISIPAIMALSLLFAMLLHRKLRGVAYFRMFFIIPLVVPVASVILVWQIIFNEYGVLNHFLASLGMNPVDWMRSGWSRGVLILLYVWKNCGYNMILFLAGLASIPEEYYESARMDGAGKLRCFYGITLPFLIPTTFFVLIMSFINSFKVFREAYLLGGSYPHLDIYMLQHFMNNNFFNLSYQRLTTAAFIMTVVILVLVAALMKTEARFKDHFN